jgi:hypothetical protein
LEKGEENCSIYRRSICRTLLIFRPLRTIEQSFLEVQSQGLGIGAGSKAEITKQIRAINYAIGRKEDELSKCMAAEGVDPPPPPPRAYALLSGHGSSVAAVGIEQSRTGKTLRTKPLFGQNKRDLLTA